MFSYQQVHAKPWILPWHRSPRVYPKSLLPFRNHTKTRMRTRVTRQRGERPARCVPTWTARPGWRMIVGQRMNPPLVFPNPALEWCSGGRTEKVGQLMACEVQSTIYAKSSQPWLKSGFENIGKLKDNRNWMCGRVGTDGTIEKVIVLQSLTAIHSTRLLTPSHGNLVGVGIRNISTWWNAKVPPCLGSDWTNLSTNSSSISNQWSNLSWTVCSSSVIWISQVQGEKMKWNGGKSVEMLPRSFNCQVISFLTSSTRGLMSALRSQGCLIQHGWGSMEVRQ